MNSFLLDGVPAALKARRACLAKRGLLLLRGSALLLLCLLSGGGVLPTALSACSDCADGCAGSGIAADDFADDGATRRAAQARTRGCARGCCLGLRSRLWLGRARRVKARLLNRPGVARPFVVLLLFRGLPFGGINVLLGQGAGKWGQGQEAEGKQFCIHGTPFL